MYLISAYFDMTTNKKIQRYINQIADKTGNTFMTENQVPPHMTISSVEARSADVLLPYAAELEVKLTRGEVQFVSVGSFFPYVLYMTPVLNGYLQNLSKTIFDVMSKIDGVSVSKYYQPMQWFPHVTLGKKLSKIQMREAFAVMQDGFSPFTGVVTFIGLARLNPHEDVWKMEMKK